MGRIVRLIQSLTDDWANKLGPMKNKFRSRMNLTDKRLQQNPIMVWELWHVKVFLMVSLRNALHWPLIIPAEGLHKVLRIFPTVTTRYLNFYPSQELIYVCFWFISAQMMHIACKLFCRGKIWISSELTSTSPFCILSHHSLFDCIFKKVIAGMSCQGVYDPKFM